MTYLYNVNFQEYEASMCSMELRALFGEDINKKVFFSTREINPSISPFIKNRLMILLSANTIEDLIQRINESKRIEVVSHLKYIKLQSGDPYAAKRNSLCKEILEALNQDRGDKTAHLSYAMTFYEGLWYFGIREKNNKKWQEHKKKPHSYSNSLKSTMAKVLVNVAGQGDTSKRILDPCCGAGTVLLEGCFSSYDMTGSDINEKMVESSKKNLLFFDYRPSVVCSPVQALEGHYDAAIVDLPYGLYSQTSEAAQLDIMIHSKRLAKRLVIVSSSDISALIDQAQLEVIEKCISMKSVNKSFVRYIWLCQ